MEHGTLAVITPKFVVLMRNPFLFPFPFSTRRLKRRWKVGYFGNSWKYRQRERSGHFCKFPKLREKRERETDRQSDREREGEGESAKVCRHGHTLLSFVFLPPSFHFFVSDASQARLWTRSDHLHRERHKRCREPLR